MSLPREWSLQNSRGSLHRNSGPPSTFPTSSTEQESLVSSKFPQISNSSVPNYENEKQTPNKMALLADYPGSLFSIQSAPPSAFTELGGCITPNRFIGTESPKRPISLAIEPVKTNSLLHQTSEIDDEDNENLLTVSSLTARPLIAKSRELRSNRLAEMRKRKTHSTEPPDGGFGWLVVFGAFSVQFWVAGLVKSYGVLYVEIMETYPSSSAALASWIPAILSALCLALSPLSSALCQRFSCRSVVFVGGIFCALGLTLSYFATSMIHLLFTFGVLTGIGGGLSTTPGIIIVSTYFTNHRALANGICVSGTAAGSFVFPMLIEHLVHLFGFHGTILILGGCMLHVCASASIYRPLVPKTDSSINNNSNGTRHISNNINTTSTYISSSEEPLNRKYIEHLFLEETKNKMNDYYNTNKFVNPNEKILQIDSDDECKDVVGETAFMKQMAAVRNSTILHSVEDLSTDSTWVYKTRSGFDSNRGSKKRNNNAFSTDEITSKHPVSNIESSLPVNSNRGLSKSMIIPTPISDFSEFDDDIKINSRSSCLDWIRRYLDISLLKDPVFILMCLSVTLMSTGSPYMLFYLPAYVISAGYTKTEAGYLVAVSAVLDLIGRLGLGYLSDLQIFDRKKVYIVSIFGAGIAVLMIPLANSWYLIGCAAAAYGLCLGCWYLLMPVLLADIFGTDRISSSYGLIRMFQSIGAISVPPLAGYLRDLSGGYEICFFCMGTCMVLGSLPLIISTIVYKNLSLPEQNEGSNVS